MKATASDISVVLETQCIEVVQENTSGVVSGLTDDEVSQVGVLSGHSTHEVELGHERRSAAAAEDEDERPGRPLEVSDETSRDAVRDRDYVGVMRRSTVPHRLECVQHTAA